LGVQVHGQDPVDGRGDAAGWPPVRGDGHARLVLAVLPGVAIKGQHGVMRAALARRSASIMMNISIR